jgi:hypothetical protein
VIIVLGRGIFGPILLGVLLWSGAGDMTVKQLAQGTFFSEIDRSLKSGMFVMCYW